MKLNEAIQKLSPVYKTIIIYRYINELTNKEIAEILNISEKTVAANHCRAMINLKKNYLNSDSTQ